MRKSELMSHYREILNRDDLTDELAELFMSQGLSRIGRTLRIPSMERVAYLEVQTDEEIGENFVWIPRDYLALKNLYLAGGDNLKRKEWGQFLRYPKTGHAPAVYARHLRRWYLRPTPGEGTKVVVHYYGELLPLLELNDSDPLLQTANDLVVYSALGYAATFFLDERKPLFEEEYNRIHAELMAQAEDQEFAEGSISVAGDTDLEY